MQRIKEIMESLTGEEPFQVVGLELRYTCPFCKGVNANPGAKNMHKFYINTQTGLWIDFQCGRKGSLTELVTSLLGTSYPQAKEWLKKRNFSAPRVTYAESKTPDLFTQLSIVSSGANEKHAVDLDKLVMPAPPTNCKYLMKHFKDREAFPFFNYLHRRGLTLDDIKRYHISYVVNGIYTKRDGSTGGLSNSVVFFTKYNGKYCYWNTRNIYNGVPKSLNASAQVGQFSRKDVVFNLNNLQPHQNVYVAEGVFNGITLDHINSKGLGVCTYGKNISQNQMNLLVSKQHQYNKIYLCLDSDAFDTSSKDFNKFIQSGLDRNKLYVVDDRSLGLKDWNDIGSKKSAELIHEKAFKPTFYSKLEKMI